MARASLAQASAATRRPGYDPDAVAIGIVHLGPGAFHRAHQAEFADSVLASDPRWGICAVSLHSTGVRDALMPQDGLYTAATLDAEIGFRVIGSIREVLVAPEDPERVLARLAAAGTHLVTLTITEKGYCLDADGALDATHPDVAHDRAHPHIPRSAIGYLVEGLRRRRAAGLAPFTVLSCDNLVDNGHRLGAAVRALAAANDRGLAAWIESEGAFPRTMVDSIVPATDDALRARVAAATGLRDAWPVQREAFTQWVIEDRACGPMPDLAAVGATLTDDVPAYVQAKLRLLNGAHSTLAYLGLLAGHASVGEAMDDAALAGFVRVLMREDILPSLRAPQGLDLDAYVDAVLARFRNPSIRHALAQIAWDGSQKLPFRLFGTIADALAAGRGIDRLCLPVAAWMHFVRQRAGAGERVTDPLAERLFELGRACDGSAAADVPRFLALHDVFPPALRESPAFREALAQAYDCLRVPGCVGQVLRQFQPV
ncbi:mannitol dehydrogenase family protein [Coralloluteibacterium stylophorae]|uniref:Mannitol dehydrogenase family protein n=1 Tax=Coralloluteibacterium stylophorae TaxID=1776034 RepID=A0A8J7VS33_9GAMM|nr:mannitol dehydrogenase family protein [Coralloluteibacterium stylophorae]MBS7458166.1 mannitol dehydrogenase family protein [Coralloluteibacterium stylophorae]